MYRIHYFGREGEKPHTLCLIYIHTYSFVITPDNNNYEESKSINLEFCSLKGQNYHMRYSEIRLNKQNIQKY